MAVGKAGVLREGVVWWPEEISNRVWCHGIVSHLVPWVIQGDFPPTYMVLVYTLVYLGGSLSRYLHCT